MSQYRRLYIEGGVYFLTLVTHDRKPILCEKPSIERLKLAFHYAKNKFPFQINGLVILPDHLHCILQLPEKDDDFSKRINMIKRYFSIGMKAPINHRREKNIWQKRFWEHCIRDDNDYKKCLDYIYYNPVKHGYVKAPHEWAFSTFKRDVAKGIYERNWARSLVPMEIQNMNYE
jgi:putative transposase